MNTEPASRDGEDYKPDRHWLWAFNDWRSKVGDVPVQLSDAFLAGMAAARSERPALYDKGDVAVAIDCLRWMALCGRVSPQDIAVACMGAATGKDWVAALNRITDPFVPAEHRTTSNERN